MSDRRRSLREPNRWVRGANHDVPQPAILQQILEFDLAATMTCHLSDSEHVTKRGSDSDFPDARASFQWFCYTLLEHVTKRGSDSDFPMQGHRFSGFVTRF